jgi:DNA-3-methyladenine glycosylase I
LVSVSAAAYDLFPVAAAERQETQMQRCDWCGTDPLYVDYHDTEWGMPEHDPRALWEKLVLDGFQAGLAWITILRKRDNFRQAFAGFEPEVIARWGEPDVARLLADPGIVRHRGKIEATIGNARAWLAIEEAGGFAPFLWRFVDGAPVQNRWASMADVPAETATSKAMSKALKAAGFRFCGPTIVYAFMQATGMVNDHLTGCPRHAEVAAQG